MLTTLTWCGIGGLTFLTALTMLISGIKTRNPKTVGVVGAFTATLLFSGFIVYLLIILGVRVLFPAIGLILLAILCWVWFSYLINKDPDTRWEPTIMEALTTVTIMTVIQGVALFGTLNWWSTSIIQFRSNLSTTGHVAAPEKTSRNTLVRSKLIEQNTQRTEAQGETFLVAGSFTLKSDGDFKIYHVWQERDPDGTLHINTAQDGEGKDEKNRDKAVIKDDVPAGAEPYVERIPVYETDPLFVQENNGKLCVKNQDTGCRVNAKHSYDKTIIHVPAGSIIPSVDPNLPVTK